MRTSELNARLLGRLVGGFLCLAGLSFIILLVFLKVGGQLSGDVKVSVFMAGCGVLLLWLGSNWFSAKERSTTADPQPAFDPFWLSCRRPVEALAALGCAAMLCHAIASALHRPGLPNWLLWVLIAAPVIVAWYILRIFKPEAFPSHVFPESSAARRAAPARLLVRSVLQIGWLGYVGILSFWFQFDALVPSEWRVPVQSTASLMVSLLFASQVLLIHFGELRSPNCPVVN
jgi:hypothetical protein